MNGWNAWNNAAVNTLSQHGDAATCTQGHTRGQEQAVICCLVRALNIMGQDIHAIKRDVVGDIKRGIAVAYFNATFVNGDVSCTKGER